MSDNPAPKARDDDWVLVRRGILGAANYIIRNSGQSRTATARAMRSASMQPAHSTDIENAANASWIAAITANRERDEA